MSKAKRDIPHYNLPIIETHCHLDYLKDRPLDETLRLAAEVGVERIITIAVAADNLQPVYDISQQYAQVYGTQGIHPHDAEDYSDAIEQRIRDNLGSDKMLAVGEIGLDYYYDHADRAVQRRVFERQLGIAVEQSLPVVIHTRNADEDTRAILQNFAAQMPRKGVIHSFTSGMALAEYCLGEGFKLGFNGICTFNKADNVRAVVGVAPLTQILLETDAPYLTPVPYRGRENAPCYLPFIAEKIAEVKNLSVSEVLKQAYQNSLETFFSTQA